MRQGRGFLAALALLATTARGAGPAPDRPLGVGTPGTLRALFLDMALSDARLARGAAVELRWWMANDWTVPTALTRHGRTVDVRIDEQADVLAASLAIPWNERLATSFEARVVEHWGGWSDGPIEAWHRLVGADDSERELFRRNQVHLVLAERGGPTAAALGGPQLAFGDVVLRTQWLVAGAASASGPEEAPPRRPALSLRLDLKAPTGRLSRLGGSGGWDAGVGLAATAPLLRWLTGHALLHAQRVSGLTGFPLRPRPWQGGLDASLVVTLPHGLALLLEDRLASPLFEGGWRPVDEGYRDANGAAAAALAWNNQITGGVRWRGVTVWVSEDFTPGRLWYGWFYNTNVPDLVVGVAWAGRGW